MSRLEDIMKDPSLAKNVREAVDFLERSGVFAAIKDDILDVSLDPRTESAEHVAAATMYSTIGAKEVLNTISSLTAPVSAEITDVAPDFGAREALREQGYTDAEIDEAFIKEND